MGIIGWVATELPLAWLAEIVTTVVALFAADPTLTLPSNPDEQGIASRFGDPGDKWVGGNLYCAPNRRVNQTEHACAHRYAGYKRHPCGSILILENPRTKKRSWCRVMDRGPYGADVLSYDETKKKYVQVYYFDKKKRKRKRWYVKIRAKDKPPASKCPSQNCVGRWRGFLDLSPAVSNELGHNGMERIRAWRIERVLKFLHWLEKKKKRTKS